LPERGSTTPVLVVVDADQQARMETAAALIRRFEPDYRVVSAEAPSTGLAVLEQLAHNGEDVALIAADLRLPGMDGVVFLEQAQELHRDASRVLLLAMDRYHTRIPFTELATLQRATALGRIDFSMAPPASKRRRWLGKRCTLSAERTRPARQHCIWRGSLTGLRCWSVASHWPPACPTIWSDNWRRPQTLMCG
jgi:thioredoxin reductase (NADPH)